MLLALQILINLRPSYSGGFDAPTGRLKTPEEIKKQREEYGIFIDVPVEAKQIIQKSVSKILAKPKTSFPALRSAFDRAEIEYRISYEVAFRLEMQRRIDEENTVLLLMIH